MVAFDLLVCQPRQGKLESSDVLPPASESARFGWLDVLNKREKGMPKEYGYSTADSCWNGKPQTLNG